MKLNILLATTLALAVSGQAFAADPASASAGVPSPALQAAVATPGAASWGAVGTLVPSYVAGGVAVAGVVAISADNKNSHTAGTGGTSGTGGTTGTTGTTGTN